MVYYIIFSILKNKEESEDVMQQVYMKVYEKIDKYTNSPKAWISSIARNFAINIYNKNKKEKIDYYDDVNFSKIPSKNIETPIIALASKILDEEDFLIVTLCVVEQYKRREVAKILNLSTSEVTWKLNNALDKLRKELQDENKDLKKHLKNESKHFVPDMKEQVYASVGYSKPESRSLKASFNSILKPILSLTLVMVITLFLLIKPIVESNSHVIVEINPSIEIEVNTENKVVDVIPFNTDGYFFLETLMIENLRIEEALIKIVDEAILQGYLLSETIKISVSPFSNNKKTESLMNEKIHNSIEEHKPGIINKNHLIKEEATKHNVTVGKMVIIKKAMEANPSLTIETAAKMEVKALVSIVNS